jgi:hypothetical protein
MAALGDRSAPPAEGRSERHVRPTGRRQYAPGGQPPRCNWPGAPRRRTPSRRPAERGISSSPRRAAPRLTFIPVGRYRERSGCTAGRGPLVWCRRVRRPILIRPQGPRRGVAPAWSATCPPRPCPSSCSMSSFANICGHKSTGEPAGLVGPQRLACRYCACHPGGHATQAINRGRESNEARTMAGSNGIRRCARGDGGRIR